jgi:hypothetical protein
MMRITPAAIAVLISLSTATAACSSGASVDAADTSDGAGSTQTSAAPATKTASQEVKGFVRTCETNVYGKLDPRGWRERSIVAGPVAFWYADEYARAPASLFTPVPGGSSRYQGA